MTKKLLLGAVAIAAALTACTAGSPDRTSGLHALDKKEYRAFGAMAHTVADRPYLIGDMNICVDHAPARITSVTLDGPLRGQLQLQAWAVRSTDLIPAGEETPGALAGTISQYRNFSHDPVTTTCANHDDAVTELLLQVVRTGTQSATVPSVLIDYAIGKAHGQTRQYFEFSLCAKADPFTEGHCT